MSIQTQISLPADQAARLMEAARAMGLDLPAFLLFLEQCHRGGLDWKSRDAARYMFSKHGESLRKLAQ